MTSLNNYRFDPRVHQLVDDIMRMVKQKVLDNLAEWENVRISVNGEIIVDVKAEGVLGTKEEAIQSLSRGVV